MCTPFTTIGPCHASRIHVKSSHDTIDCSSAAPTSAYGIGPSFSTTFGNFIKPPSRRNAASQRGRARNWKTYGNIVNGAPDTSSFVPLRTSRSRFPATGVSTVTTSAEQPPFFARSMPPRHVAPSDDIELVPDRPARGRLHVADRAARQRRERVDRARLPRRARRDFFAARPEKPRTADRRENKRQVDGFAEDRRSQIAFSVATFLHCGELLCPKKALILRCDSCNDNHQARASQDLIQGSRLATQGLDICGGQPGIVGPNMTTERAKQWQYRLTKVAQSDQTDVLSEESESLAVGSQAVLLGPSRNCDPTG